MFRKIITPFIAICLLIGSTYCLNAQENEAKKYRRIVTGINSQGKSYVWLDGHAPVVKNFEGAGIYSTEIWESRQAPADNSGEIDLSDHEFVLGPPKAGTRFRIVEFLPEPKNVSGESLEGSDAHVKSDKHPMMHATDSVDCIIMLEGEIFAILEEGEVLLKTGDVFIQRGTAHAWSNRSDKPAIFAAVLVDAKPIGNKH